MAAAHKGAISFGLVHIPVGMYTATQDVDIHFNQLHKEDNSRIRYKKTCGHCGKEVASSDIVSGFEYSDGKYVVMDESDFEKARTEKDKTIHILHFADLDEIRPIYFNKTYHVVPEPGGDKAFELLRQAMLQENKVAIAKTVIRNSEELLCILPTQRGIHIETLFYAEEVTESPREPARPELSEAELSMAKQLINGMVKPFEPGEYHNEYQKRLREIIEDKINGKEIVAAAPERADNVIDLMEALKQSVAKFQPEQPEQEKPKRGRPKKTG